MSGAPVDYVSDWLGRLRALVYAQFRKDPVIDALIVNVIAPQAQDLEDSLQTLVAISSISDSVGVQLDNIGQIVGQPRLGFADDEYRLLLYARIRAARSSGAMRDIYAVFDLAAPGKPSKITPGGNASFTFDLEGAITDAELGVYIDLLYAAKLAGVRVVFEYQLYPDSEMFFTDWNGMLRAPASISDTSLQVAGIDDTWPTSGTVRIDPGLATQEDVSYTSIVDSTDLVLSSAIAQAHDVHSVVSFIAPASPGLGYGDYNDPTVGGYMAGAALVTD